MVPLGQQAFINPDAVDTITVVTTPTKYGLPRAVRSAIRYRCMLSGYRTFFVTERASEVATAWRRAMRREDPAYTGPMGEFSL
jgi:hypothetical protein